MFHPQQVGRMERISFTVSACVHMDETRHWFEWLLMCSLSSEKWRHETPESFTSSHCRHDAAHPPLLPTPAARVLPI